MFKQIPGQRRLPLGVEGDLLSAHWAFAGQHGPQDRIIQDVSRGMRLVIDPYRAVDQPDAVAVIHVLVAVSDVERLNWQSVRLLPAVECCFPGFLQQTLRKHQVFFDA
jgi:hypothetical protein